MSSNTLETLKQLFTGWFYCVVPGLCLAILVCALWAPWTRISSSSRLLTFKMHPRPRRLRSTPRCLGKRLESVCTGTEDTRKNGVGRLIKTARWRCAKGDRGLVKESRWIVMHKVSARPWALFESADVEEVLTALVWVSKASNFGALISSYDMSDAQNTLCDLNSFARRLSSPRRLSCVLFS